MASPFTVFRKNQKILIATLGLLAMIAFVFLPIILKNMGSREAKNSVVVKTKRFGNIREQRLWHMVQRRQMVMNFLTRAVSVSGSDPRFVQMYLESYIGPTTEEAVVDAWLRGKMAEELGLDVTDNEVNTFLKEVTGDRVTPFQFSEILNNLRISQGQLFDSIRTELLAMNFRQLFSQSIEGSPPAERWEYFLRLNRRATVEIAPIPVAKFVSRIVEPDESALQAFFDKYKDVYSDPTSAEPGFREPRKIALQYFKASYNDFIDPKSVSEEEVRQYYEQFKDVHYLAADLPSLDEEGKVEGNKAESGKPKAEENKAKSGKPKAESEAPKEAPAKKPETKKPVEKAAAKESEAKKPVEKAAAKEPAKEPEAKKPVEKEPAKEPEAKKPVEKEPAKEPAKESSARSDSPFRLVSFLQEAGGKGKEAKEPKTDKPTTKADKPVEAPKLTDPNSEKKPVTPDKKPVTPEKKPVEPDKKPVEPDKKPVKKAAGDVGAGEKPDGLEKPVKSKYVPLEKVEGEIRKILARERAGQKIEEVMAPLRDMMRKYRDKKILYDADQKEAPVEPDFAALAKKNRLSTHRTDLISAIQAVQLDIGRSNVESRIPLVNYAFEKLPEFRPATSQDNEGNIYLFWKTADVEDRIPTLDDKGVLQRVSWAWKLNQARRLALQEAETLAAEARKSKKSLKDTFAKTAGVVVTTTSPFSWMTHGAVPASMSQQPPKLSEVAGVDMPGDDFMRTVFDLDVGQVGIAMNRPQTAIYVVRPSSVNPSPTVLWELFLADDFSKYASVAYGDQRQILDSWQEELKAAAGLIWQRKPDQHGQANEGD